MSFHLSGYLVQSFHSCNLSAKSRPLSSFQCRFNKWISNLYHSAINKWDPFISLSKRKGMEPGQALIFLGASFSFCRGTLRTSFELYNTHENDSKPASCPGCRNHICCCMGLSFDDRESLSRSCFFYYYILSNLISHLPVGLFYLLNKRAEV